MEALARKDEHPKHPASQNQSPEGPIPQQTIEVKNGPLKYPTLQQIARLIRLLDQTGKGLTSGTVRIVQGDQKDCVPLDVRPVALYGMRGIETRAEFVMDSEERGWILEHAFTIDESNKDNDPELQIFRRSYEDSPYGGTEEEWAKANQIETSTLGGMNFEQLIEKLEQILSERKPAQEIQGAAAQLVRVLVRKFWMQVQQALA